MIRPPVLRRDELARALNGNSKLVVQFEQIAQSISETQDAQTIQADATDALQDATVLVLSPNTAFTNERVLRLGKGVQAVDDGGYLTISVNDEVARVEGGFSATLITQTDSAVVLPENGVVATRTNPETLSNKTLAAPVLSAIGDYASDVAAAAGGVPVGGVYRTGSALMVRAV